MKKAGKAIPISYPTILPSWMIFVAVACSPFGNQVIATFEVLL